MKWLLLSLAICGLGVSAFLTQVTLMRELLSVFSGNELVLGVVLGSWMLLTGLGASVGRGASRLRSPLAVFILAQVLVAVAPIAGVFLLRALRNVVFLRGAAVGLPDIVASCLVLLAPYCLTIGYLLALASHLMARRGDAADIGRVYFLDNVGSVLGGLLFSFALVGLFSHFGILYAAALVNLPLAGGLAIANWRSRLRRASVPACSGTSENAYATTGTSEDARATYICAVVLAAAVVVLGLMAGGDLDRLSTDLQYAGQQVVYRGQSPYGSLVVTELGGQYNFIENGVFLFSTSNVQSVEETVHYAMAQRPHAERVLLISGGIAGTAREVLKYDVASVDYVELDPLVIEVGRRYLPDALADPRIHVIATDGRLHVKQTSQRYDVVILDTAEPSTSQLNRFYTREFFAEVRRSLAPGGVFSLALGQYDGYLDEQLARLLAVTHHTLEEVFSNVVMIPGERIFFLASDGDLTSDIARRIEEAGVATRWVTRPYLAAMVTPGRMADVRRAVAMPAPVNEDFNPILYYYRLRYWMTQFSVRFGVLEGLLGLLLVVYLVRLRGVSLAVFSSGLAASALEVVLLLAFQILHGSVYRQLGLIVTMFMLGLGIGSWTATRLLARRGRRDLVWLTLAIGAYAACLPPVLIGLGRLESSTAVMASQVIVPLLTLLLAALVGAVFPLAAKLDFQDAASTAARLFTADYVGAALGALLVSTLLVPVLGVSGVCLAIAGMCVLSGAGLVVRSKYGG